MFVLEGPDSGVDDVHVRLTAEFRTSIATGVIDRVMLLARNDLQGQVNAAAMPELLHRLARQRLADLRPADRCQDDRVGPTILREAG